MKIKSNKGVTLIVLTIMVVVLLIITGMLIYGSKSQIRTKKLNELYDDIEILNSKVSEYYLKNGSIPLVDENTPYITNTSEGKDFENLLKANGANEISFNVNDDENYYVLDINKLEKYKKSLITKDVILTDERLYEHILLFHGNEYKELRPHIKSIIDDPDYIIEDNRHEDTMIYLKQMPDIEKNGRVVIKLALGQDKEHSKNSIITMMKLNNRTWKQTLKNRGKIIWNNKKKN